MKEYSLSCQIREGAAPDGGLLLELLVEGEEPPYARATASAEHLDLLRKWHGLQRSDVTEHLHRALLKCLRTEDYTTEITNVIQVPPFRLRYLGWFTDRNAREISTGVVWYDLLGNLRWPELEEPFLHYRMKSLVFDLLAEEDRAENRAQPQQVSAS